MRVVGNLNHSHKGSLRLIRKGDCKIGSQTAPHFIHDFSHSSNVPSQKLNLWFGWFDFVDLFGSITRSNPLNQQNPIALKGYEKNIFVEANQPKFPTKLDSQSSPVSDFSWEASDGCWWVPAKKLGEIRLWNQGLLKKTLTPQWCQMIFSQITKRQNICNYYYNISTWSFLKCRNFQIVCSTFWGGKKSVTRSYEEIPRSQKTHHATGELNHLGRIIKTL